MGWTVKKLVAAAALAAMILIFSLPGITINAVAGAGAGAVNALVQSAMLVIAALTLRTFGTVTLTYTIFAILAIPLPALGTPGFVPKVLLALIGGFAFDVVFFATKKHVKLASFLAPAVSGVVFALAYGALFKAFGIAGAERFLKIALSPLGLAVFSVLGGLAGLLGLFIYKKLEKTAVVRRVQEGKA